MGRRKFIKKIIGCGIVLHPAVNTFSSIRLNSGRGLKRNASTGPESPLYIYNNWSSYDELSDTIPLTEELAMKEMNELIRWKKNGVEIDYYVMDAFWFDKWGGYRTWNREHWPDGPGRWFDACLANDIKPGMWFSTNLIATGSGRFLEVIPEWEDSLASESHIMCLFKGGYLDHLAETLQIWADRGVKAFKFDFAYFNAATVQAKKDHLPEEIEEMNKVAFISMLKRFRSDNPGVLILGYNGFGGQYENTYEPFNKTVDHRWLEVFDTLYCGDPRFSDVPAMNIWRSGDIYSDHMVRQYEFNGVPLQRIDNCGFMIGKTGTCYYRADHAWKGMLILELARGGWVNVYHGNLELLDDSEVKWFAKVQGIFHPLQKSGRISTFGELPGSGKPYGFKAEGMNGTVITVVNPSQGTASIDLPISTFLQARIMFADGGFKPSLNGNRLILGPEQLVVTGFDEYADPSHDLGRDDSVQIPSSIRMLETSFETTAKNTIEGTVMGTPGENIRIIAQQFGSGGLPRRTWGGGPPDGKKMDTLLSITVKQEGRILPVKKEYDKMIWSGLSWAAVELDQASCDTAKEIRVECRSAEPEDLILKAWIYGVKYT